jgi:SAM-dependent methyltransferase
MRKDKSSAIDSVEAVERPFDAYASEYDAWFLENRNVLESEKRLVRRMLGEPGRTLSVGCGSGLFEHLLRVEDDIVIEFGIEPSAEMAKVAEHRGMRVTIGSAEDLPYDDGSFDTLLFNGTPSYIDDLAGALGEAHRVLRPGGHVVLVDVPAESSYGLLYRLAAEIGTWDDPLLAKVAPAHPYPIEFAAAANWRTTEEKIELLEAAGFTPIAFGQTLTRHPKYSNDEPEDPSEGYGRGDYVGIRAQRT